MVLPLLHPDREAQQHSERLMQVIQARIQMQGGVLSFADFMQACLYEPGLGYYAAGAQKIGAAGDFVTAPEISPLFSYALAEQCKNIFSQIGQQNILEFGAGLGTMAADILFRLSELNSLPDHYFILEISPELRERQQKTLREKIPTLFNRIIWLETLPEKFNGIVLANEVLDAMPVHIFSVQEGQFQEQCVGINSDGFTWISRAITEPHLTAALDLISKEVGYFSEGYTSEINLMISPWIKSLYDMMSSGVVLLIDYGFGRKTYYHPERSMGTLMCHYRHRAHSNPFLYPGLQDITAHVDFTALAEAGTEAGFTLEGFTTQAAFLMGNRLLENMTTEDLKTRFELNQQIHQLTSPTEMGELFKVMALSKMCMVDLQGFAGRDDLYQL